MRLLKGLVARILLLAAGLFAYGVTLPNTLHVERDVRMLKAYVAAYGHEKAAADEWEQYVSDPGQTPAAELVTVIYWPPVK